MSKKRDVAVNDLARYEKSSDRLVLESYSHCEVPAGCGGGILRWIDPDESLPLTLHLWSTGKNEVFFDGAPVKSGRVDARRGAHVLAVHVSPEGGAPPQIALALRYSDETAPKDGMGPYRSKPVGRKVDVLSGRAAVMVATSLEPEGDEWKKAAFGAAGWRALAETAPHLPDGKPPWHLKEILKTGAVAVGLPGARGPLWVRCVLDVTLGDSQ